MMRSLLRKPAMLVTSTPRAKSSFACGSAIAVPRPPPMIAAFLMLVSHGTYYGFFSIHLENLGYDKTFIGLAWALASVAEILVMIRSDALLKNTAIEKILIFSFIVAACRWALLFFAQSSSVILFSQVLHAVTYGAFHIASILYIDKLIPAEAKTFGQAVNNAVTYGLGLTAGFMFNGISANSFLFFSG